MIQFESIDRESNNFLMKLINELQKELIIESGALNDSEKKINWINNNAAKFRLEFEKLWQEISQDANYQEILYLFNHRDIESLKKILLPIIKERMKK